MSEAGHDRPANGERTERREVRSAGFGRISTLWDISSCPSPLFGSSRSEQRANLTGLS